jgi:hypothetical protein
MQKFATKMAKARGNFDKLIAYSEKDINREFYNENKHILECEIGGGYWLWKPYLICKTLDQMEYGDYLFYSDSGAFFLKNVDILIDELDTSNQDIMGFEGMCIEYQFTKQELFENMDCNNEEMKNSNKINASFFLVKKTEFSVIFFEEVLNYSTNEINITDDIVDSKQPKDFLKHTHDESIFSLLYKKYSLKPFKEPSQFGQRQNLLYLDKKGINIEKNKIYLANNIKKIRLKNYNEKYEMVLFHHRTQHPLRGIIAFGLRYFLFLRNPNSRIGYYFYKLLRKPYSIAAKTPFVVAYDGKKYY